MLYIIQKVNPGHKFNTLLGIYEVNNQIPTYILFFSEGFIPVINSNEYTYVHKKRNKSESDKIAIE